MKQRDDGYQYSCSSGSGYNNVQDYSNVTKSFDRHVLSAENVLATSIVVDFMNCFLLEEHSYIGNSEVELRGKAHTHKNKQQQKNSTIKQWGIAFFWLDLPE